MEFSALIGNPVEHSVSPKMFEQFAKSVQLEYTHLKLRVPNEEVLPKYMNSLKTIGCKGVNVTLPYKIAIMKYLDELDSTAQEIGAVNTVVMKDDSLIGYNTDGWGAFKAIEDFLRKIEATDQVVVLGAGGAARAIIFEIYKVTENIVVLCKNINEAKLISRDFRNQARKPIEYGVLSDAALLRELKRANFLINATPVGMYPNVNSSLVTEGMFEKITKVRDMGSLYVFDAVFNPHTTCLLKLARNHGANICSGIWMMIYQGFHAFQLWTGIKLSDIDFLAVERELRKAIVDIKEIKN